MCCTFVYFFDTTMDTQYSDVINYNIMSYEMCRSRIGVYLQRFL